MKHILIIYALLVLTSTPLLAQQPPPDKPQSADLTEGLLDLLKEPTEEQQVKPNPVPNVPGNKSTQPDSPTEGEDLGQASEHPLLPIQQSMTQLATWLRSGSEREKSAQLQRDVIVRLDELIAQMEQQPAANQSSSSSSSSSSQSTSSKSAGRDQRSGKPGEKSSPPAGGDSQVANNGLPGQSSANEQGQRTGQSQPGPGDQRTGQAGQDQSGESQPGTSPLGNRTAIVDLNDPTALQRSAWGNLPQRMREQMQSRMVERFLPGYREEIEAYYRALSK